MESDPDSPRPAQPGPAPPPPALPEAPPPRPQSAPGFRAGERPRRPCRRRPLSSRGARSAGTPRPVREHAAHSLFAKRDDQPGPGFYCSDSDTASRVRGAVMSRAQRFQTFGEDMGMGAETPGPAAYVVTDEYRDKRLLHRFGKMRRDPLRGGQSEPTPGPGGHDAPLAPPDEPHAPSVKFGTEGRDVAQKRSGANHANVPGPGAYGAEEMFRWVPRGPAYRLGPRRDRVRRMVFSRQQCNAKDNWRTRFYHCDATTINAAPLRDPQYPNKPRSPVARFSKAARGAGLMQQQQDAVPGPGAYEAAEAAGRVMREPAQVGIMRDGRRFPHGMPSAQLGRETRDVGVAEATVAAELHWGTRGVPIGKAARGSNVGPAAGAADEPGPGQYHTTAGERSKAPVHRFATGPREARGADTLGPGPGGYDIAEAGSRLGPRQQPQSFPKGPRSWGITAMKWGSIVPGPGAYLSGPIGASVTGVRRGKRLRKRGRMLVRSPHGGIPAAADAPGPQYNPSVSSVRPSAPAVSFPKSARSTGSAGDGPGPADYFPSRGPLQRHAPTAMLYLTG